jgi:hypothetical protein
MIIFKSAPYDDTGAIADLGKVIVVDSNVAEDATHAEWDVATNYTAGDIVKVTAQHKLYESITGGTGHNPVSTLGTNWIEFGATNRWKAFDQYIQSRTVADVDDITYQLQTNTLITAIAFFNLSGKSLTVRVYSPQEYNWLVLGIWDDDISLDPSEVTPSFQDTRVLIDQTALVDWFEYFYAETTPQTEVVVLGLPGFTGYIIDIEIEDTSSPAAVGEIAIGKQNNIGDLLTGGRIGQLSFSGVNEDVFGNLEIIPRDAAKLVDYPVSWPSSDTRRIEKILEEVRDQPTVFLGHENCAESEAYGMLSYGFYREFDISIVSRSVVFATITVRTLT